MNVLVMAEVRYIKTIWAWAGSAQRAGHGTTCQTREDHA